MYDSDNTDAIGILSMSRKLFSLYERLHTVVDEELMKLDKDDLLMMKLIYSDQLTYPISDHIDQLLDGAPPSETLH